ncbi:unnamed protein product [Linum tenue]|uniref:Orange protein n=1 Tax=Linum tenue TaxID=586396 RepID=A0AAV0HFV4_9ROSI|nr:unnamed protein product [Linum tenue]CAI0547944.1 unnamed protein product [Linum tenue]
MVINLVDLWPLVSSQHFAFPFLHLVATSLLSSLTPYSEPNFLFYFAPRPILLINKSSRLCLQPSLFCRPKMVSLARALAVSYPAGCPCTNTHAPRRWSSARLITLKDPNSRLKWRSKAADSDNTPPPPLPSTSAAPVDAADSAAAGFCIIEGPETVQDFDKMELQEIQDNIRSRRNKIFLHMEEVRRLRIQQRIKSAEVGISDQEPESDLPDFPSFIPFLPPLTAANLKVYYGTCFSLISGIIIFGGLLAPTLELKLGLGGTTYADFITSMHLPMQLSQVDPIVASFSGGAVGVISALMVVEVNNVKQQEHKRCKYCIGTGYLACARCSNTGTLVLIEPVSTTVGSGGDKPLSAPKTERCPNCSGSGKVMCPTCLCTGMAMASEHDPRIDPFD